MDKKTKILLLDNELDFLSKIYIEFLLQNFEVEVTSNPREIAPRAKRFLPDIAIVNSDIEGFDGSEVCKVLKGELKIPIALLVQKHSSSTLFIDSCKADEVLVKPVATAQLRNMIIKMVGSK